MKKVFFVSAAAVIGLLTDPAMAGAQTCTGSAPMDGFSLQLGATVGGTLRPTPALAVSGTVGVGYKRMFGSIDYSRNSFTGLGYSLQNLTGTVGVQLPAWRSKTWFCPTFSYGRSAAANLGPSLVPPFELVDVRQLSAFRNVSIAVGQPIAKYRKMTVVPTASGGVSQSYLIATDFLFAQTGVKSTAVIVQGGVGLIFGRRTSVILAVAASPWNSDHFDASVTYFGTMTIKVK
jgi:hypothetical protein